MNKHLAIAAPRIFDGQNWHEDAVLLVDNGQVKTVLPISGVPKNIAIEYLNHGMLVPGLVDLQVNGGGGVLFNNQPDVAAIEKICAAHLSLGTTALFPTLISDTQAVQRAAIAAAIQAHAEKIPGFAGLHLEGPHLSRSKKGAHKPELIRPMDDQDLENLITARPQLPALLLTVAPENVTPAQVAALVKADIKVSIGHSNAGAREVEQLISAGAGMITHLFNAMSQISARQPGVAGAALNSGDVHVGLIADGYHVHPGVMEMALRAKKPPGRIFLISDAMSFAATDATRLVLNGREILRANGRLVLEDGTLAGADLDLAKALGVMHHQVGVDLGEALRMAALYPAQAAGLGFGGRLKAGTPADFIWLDEDLVAQATWIAGQRMPGLNSQGSGPNYRSRSG